MKTTLKASIARLIAAGLIALAAQPAAAANVTISSTPLATAGGSSILPNLLFVLDASGSMDWDFLPDYVDDSGKCMTRSGGNTSCTFGDPPRNTGGANGFNGVAYDPMIAYKPALKSDGKSVIGSASGTFGAALTITGVPNDAFGVQFTGVTDITTGIQDVRYCNSNNICKRNGADNAGTSLIGGTDDQGVAHPNGRFPYRTHKSNSSTLIYGLPEMMAMANFVRSGTTTVTVTTIAPHGLAVNDIVFVTGTGLGSMDQAVQTVVTVPSTTQFTFTTVGNTSNQNVTGSFRRHSTGIVTRAASSTTVNVLATGHGLANGDVVTVNSTADSTVNSSSRVIAVVDADNFTYVQTGGTTTAIGGAGQPATWVRNGLYNARGTTNGAANSYSIVAVEYCTDANLSNCEFVAPGNTPSAGFTFPAPVRFCRTQEQAFSPGAVSDTSGTPRCRGKFVGSGSTQWTWPRFGYFKRDIIQSGATFTRSSARTDCAGAPTCTYAEESQNYARWWAYYRTRMQMMKTASGRAFLPFISNPSATPAVPDKLRIGFITINPFYAIGSGTNSGSVQPNRWLRIDAFNTTQASNWYNMFYLQDPNQSTPLREALSRAGWIYAGKLGSGLTNGMTGADDPVQASCQRHFTLLTTDGYWNGNAGQNLQSGAIGNLDNANPTVDSGYSSPSVDRTSTGTFDGGKGTTVDTATPQYTLEQVVCQGSANSTFSGGTQQACGCGAGEHRIKQRRTDVTTTVSTTDGVQDAGSPSPGTPSYSFSNITGCSLAVVTTTTTTGATITETRVCDGNNTITFGDGQTKSCSCNGSRKELIRETRTGATVTNQTVDGIPQSPTYSGGSTAWTYSKDGTTFQSSAFTGNNCASSSTPLSPTAQNISGGTTSSNTTGTALTITMSPNPGNPVVGTPTITTVLGGYPDTLADVAMYYYRTDLRGGSDPFGNTSGPANNLGGSGTTDVSANIVPAKSGAKDFATHQHMVTFAVGLADGLMRYQADYEGAKTGDFASIKNGTSNGCFWVSGTCDWPRPLENDASALDDLWHAAVNGRGQFYLALNADALSSGIQTALTAVNSQVAAAAASATSSPNVTQTDNQIFSTTYETNTWSGKVFAQTIDPDTGNVNATIQWQADQQLLGKVATATDTRTIWTFDSTSGTLLKPFDWASLSATEQAFFLGKCVPASTMTQCTALSPAQLAIANDGSSLVGFLRGQLGNEATIFRDRTFIDIANNNAVVQTVLGDTISAKPAYLRRPQFNYADAVTPPYSNFLSSNQNRSPRVYVAANDGYLHAFHGDTGEEMWAYLPRFLMPGLYALADTGYASLHRYFADGSPETGEVFDSSAGAWKSILIAGAAGGGRGYYALDITDPSNPKGLWEFCSDATLCDVADADLGLTYGNPVIGKRALDGKWVVLLTSGLNNTGPGDGLGHFYVLDALTGAILHKVETTAGTLATPSGLMKTSAFYDSALTDGTFRYAYAGDQLGNVWRLDTRTDPPTVLHIATLTDGTTPTPRAQPITTRPSLTRLSGQRILYIGTGRYLGAPDLSDPGAASGISWQQTLWAFKDKDADYGNLRDDTNMVRQSLVQATLGSTERTISANPVDWNTKDGWYVDFNPLVGGVGASPGEGVNLVDPRLVLGTLVLSTNVPAAGGSSCSVGGSSFEYNFDFKTGAAVSTSAGGVVGRSLGGTITVGVAIVQLPSGAIKSISTGADTSKTTSAVNTSATGAAVRRFSYRVR